MPATVGAAFLTKVITTANGPVRLQLWDTFGQEKFRSLALMYYRSSAVAVLVFDVTNRQSLDGLEDWQEELSDKAPHNIKLVVIGNKSDMTDKRVVPRVSGEDLAKKIGAIHYTETSALTGAGICEVFNFIAEIDISLDNVVETPNQTAAARLQSGDGRCC
jgi:small GTP-binding protein